MARKLLGMTVEFRLAALAAKLTAAAALLTHWPLANQADCAVVLLEARVATESITRPVSFTFELGTTTRVAAAATNEPGVMNFGWEIHGTTSKDGEMREKARRHYSAARLAG